MAKHPSRGITRQRIQASGQQTQKLRATVLAADVDAVFGEHGVDAGQHHWRRLVNMLQTVVSGCVGNTTSETFAEVVVEPLSRYGG